MKKIFLLIVFSLMLTILIMAITLTSCVRQVDLTETDENYIFLSEDIKNIDLGDYHTKEIKNNNKNYFFTKTTNHLGFYGLYRVTLINDNGSEIEIKTVLSVQNEDENAVKLYKSRSQLFENTLEINPKNYNCDNILLEIDDYSYSVLLKKSKLVYEVYITGVNLKELQVKESLLKKVNYIIDNEIN